MLNQIALVVGAHGVIGRNLINHLATLDYWDIVGLSRRGGESAGRVRYVAVDLPDRANQTPQHPAIPPRLSPYPSLLFSLLEP